MFEKGRIEKNLWGWRWPLIVVVALIALLAIQVIRVNQPRPAANIQKIEYSSTGPLVPDVLVVPAENYFSHRINLNRKAKIHGKFKTDDLEWRVDILLLDDANFEKWKVGSEYEWIVQTGYVPGGRIAPVVEPGVYHLIVDNRRNTSPQTVRSDFSLE